jgi:hypothetical protein
LLRLFAWGAALLTVAVLTVLGARAWEAHQARPLSVWHTFVPEELRADQLDDADWSAYLAAEVAVFASVQREVTQRLEPDERVPANRYFEGAPMYPGRFETDWNRSFVLEPRGAPGKGIARAVAINEPGRAKAACRIAQPIPHGYQLEFRCHCRPIPQRHRRKPLRNQEPEQSAPRRPARPRSNRSTLRMQCMARGPQGIVLHSTNS